MGHILGFFKFYLQYLSAGVIFLLTNPLIRAFAIFAVYLEDVDSVEWTDFPGKTLQDLCQDAICQDAICQDAICQDAICQDAICQDAICQDAIFKNCYRCNLGHFLTINREAFVCV